MRKQCIALWSCESQHYGAPHKTNVYFIPVSAPIPMAFPAASGTGRAAPFSPLYKDTSVPAKKLTFEESLKQLESIVATLEKGSCSLDESLKQFSSGIAAIKNCESHLSRARGTVRELLTGENGEMIERLIGENARVFLGEEEEA